MRKLLALLSLALVPATVLALDLSDKSSNYSDAPFSRAESVGISVLTNAGAVEGNPDGTFAPKRTLNRAEFLKIAFESDADISVSKNDGTDCFPDVKKVDWFSPYVCMGKMREVVKGYQDGLFHPERAVTYAEALKMLTVLYYGDANCAIFDAEGGCMDIPAEPTDGTKPWYQPYVNVAQQKKLLLPIGIAYDTQLTRGQMARLTAAYLAESEGELAAYRAAETGKTLTSSSAAASSMSSGATSSTSSASSTSSLSSASSSSSASFAAGFPSRSQILVLGERSKSIASATYFANLEPMMVRSAEIVFEREINSIDAMFLLDAQGKAIGQIYLDHLYDQYDKTWRGTFSSGAYLIPKGEQRTLGIEVRLKERDKGGVSEELVEVDTFRISVEGQWGGSTVNSAPQTFAFPKHQTAQGRIVTIKNAADETAALPAGPGQQLAAFRFAAEAVPGAVMKLEHLEFQVAKSSDVTVSNWQLGTADSPERMSCSVSNGVVVSCLSLTDEFGSLSTSRTLRLYGDVTLDAGATNPYLQVTLNQPGTIGEIGAVRWTDGSGHFTWLDTDSPIARSTKFE